MKFSKSVLEFRCRFLPHHNKLLEVGIKDKISTHQVETCHIVTIIVLFKNVTSQIILAHSEYG